MNYKSVVNSLILNCNNFFYISNLIHLTINDIPLNLSSNMLQNRHKRSYLGIGCGGFTFQIQ